ncbi:uncharacterized protein LOC126370315 [Pectinophora gossypiella]|uniref:Reticulon domain-containing protein n=1 Tax=Pectinophora gossypiella TaxID=13191 RepID=A0A1E1WR34_PECGO|nr:uncharacterized protein LOC126370315 [Pectinophora gossypiella]
MTMVFKFIALSVVFGMVLAVPSAKMTAPSFDDLAYSPYSPYEIVDIVDPIADERPAAGVVLAKPNLITSIISIVSSVAGLKAKALALTVAAIGWLMSKSFVFAIGAVATFAFCKLTTKCHLGSPAVYKYVPPQVRSFVTPERLEDAQNFLMTAMQQYADKKGRSLY